MTPIFIVPSDEDVLKPQRGLGGMIDPIPRSPNQPIERDNKNKNLPTYHLDDCQAWYLVHCKPNAEQMALRNLENQGFSVFLPLQKMIKTRSLLFFRHGPITLLTPTWRC